MLEIFLLFVMLCVGIGIGRFSVKVTYVGDIVKEQTETGKIIYSLEMDQIENLDRLKGAVKFRIVPPQDALL